MTKQEEIREHLIELFEQTTIGEAPDKLADAVMWVLNEDGVVIQVDKELPSIFNVNEAVISALEYKKKLGGYVAVEPLIMDN